MIVSTLCHLSRPHVFRFIYNAAVRWVPLSEQVRLVDQNLFQTS